MQGMAWLCENGWPDVQGSIAAIVVIIIVVIGMCALATLFLARMRARRRAQVIPRLLSQFVR